MTKVRLARWGSPDACNPPKTERYYTLGDTPSDSKASPPPAIHLKGQWLKAVGFETGFTFTVKILNGCLVLIPYSEDTRAMK
ncbi:SymE family type I addiction module toxin [Providencia stuartii]|uniref:Toxin SymE-like domain-containing protein n=1 Tax=Providencia stuartii (strain MRSN 2154) TaxID=1157951 RepID=A0A140NTY8_PROSM|nr:MULTISPECIES: SymE family type I addiction module toxin [Providencia]AFH95412.1 hypothetical protein S70_18030 [Providencia stuartii MRSN 2154]MDE8745283.1 SymE family type I addiction module toxin [Providencia thailandensis]MDE8764485.1 SymE family type I addiction module toxin [Providencia thailandensis]MDE8776989.1 SymE family type I addiction module toxin [Providencia thailandensis]MDE8780978.1 SymE family type I addiction module toxin [Providencia thailandensis]